MKVSISGVRGIFGQDLTLHDVLQFSRRFSQLIDNECILARDTRQSSLIIADTASAALMEHGIDVYNLGIAPTPFAFKEARKHDAALIISASHSPVDWNGLKFVLDGRGIFEDELQNLLTASIGKSESIGREYCIKSDYSNELMELTGRINGKMKVVIDAGGGAASGYADSILSEVGCDVTRINYIYGTSSRPPDPTTDELIDLRTAVVNNKCDIGFAYDLDADRVVVVRNNGEKLQPDMTLLLCVAKSIDMGIKDFVISTDTSNAVEEYAKNRNCGVLRAKVGESYVVKKMLDNNIPAGGEGSSGGFILKDFNMCRDSILASIFITSLLHSKTYDECLQLASQYHLIRGKVEVDSSLHNEVIESLRKVLEKESSSIDYTDGIRAIIDDSWILIRGSNTEHSIRLSVESKSEERSKSLYSKYEQKIREENAKRKRDH